MSIKTKSVLICIISVLLGLTLASSEFLSATHTKEEIITQLKDYSRENLIKVALAADDYQRAKLPSQILILRGLREFINRLSNNEIKSVIASQIIDSNEELSLEKLNTLADFNLTSNDHQIMGWLGDLDIEKLKKIAIGCETYSRKTKKQEKLIGGLHDYINFLEKQDIIKIIVEYINQYPELGKNGLLLALSEEKLLTNSEVKEFLTTKSQKTLAQLAITVENYVRTKKNIFVIGGIHDYAFRLEKEQLIEIVEKYVSENPELAVDGKLDSLLTSQLTQSHPILGGIEDYLKDFSLEELKKMALEAEKYDIEKNGFRLGGLHDYINSLTKEEVLSTVVDYIKTFPELRAGGVLEKRAGINQGGLVELLKEKTIPELQSYCLSLESYDRKKRGVELDGGLHDYIDTLTRDDLISYIHEMTNKYPDGVLIGGLEKLVEEAKKATTLIY